MKKILSFLVGIAFVSVSGAQDIPMPSAYYNFNKDWFTTENHDAVPLDVGTKLPDNSTNGVDAAWYNYNSTFPSKYSGFRAGEGKWGSAAYFGGYKSLCDNDPAFPDSPDNSPASARDALFFAGNARPDIQNVIDTSNVWQGVRKKFTIAFWWKSDRDLSATGNKNACPPDEAPDFTEVETLFDGGSFWGIDIISWYNYFKIGYRNGSDGADIAHVTGYFAKADGNAPAKGEWVHIAVTFEGDSITAEGDTVGLITLYLNGELAVDFEGNQDNPNPFATGYIQFDAVPFDVEVVHVTRGAVLFGATNGASPNPDYNAGGEFWADVPQYEGKFGYIADHYRMGWAARGYLDEFAYWKDVALTQEQIKTIMNTQIADLVGLPNGIDNSSKANINKLNVYPSVSNGNFTVELNNNSTGTLQVVNMLGATVYSQDIMMGTSNVNINLEGLQGIYMVTFESGTERAVSKIIIK